MRGRMVSQCAYTPGTFVLQALTALEQKRRFALATVSTRREEAGKLT